jgi:hypothetical protein
VAHIFGIPVRFDYRWFMFSAERLADRDEPQPRWHVGRSFKLHAVASRRVGCSRSHNARSVSFRAGHELSHALMGRREGIEIEEIVLHPFGGLRTSANEPESPRAEFRIAVAGPAASFCSRDQFRTDAAGDDGWLSNRQWRLVTTLRRQSAPRCLQLFPGYPLAVVACYARFSGAALGTLKKPRASPESAAC